MNPHNMKTKPILALILLSALAPNLRAAETIAPDLQGATTGKGWTLAKESGAKVPSTAKWVANAKGKPALTLNGITWLDGVTFADGILEVDILGASKPPGSNFLGLAFRGVDDTTYDCVYFRPFNFRAPNRENSDHAVQYVSHPQWPWARLRKEKTGQYEKPIVPAPDGDEWFHAKIVVAGKKVRVFVNGASGPSLEVETLNDRASGKLGLWTSANAQGRMTGHFANLKITPAAK